jgi:hypothetical protein
MITWCHLSMQTSRVYDGSPVTVELSETREVYHDSQFLASFLARHRILRVTNHTGWDW